MSHPLRARLASAAAPVRAAACGEVARDPAGALLVEPLAAALADPAKQVAHAAGDALVALARAGSGDAVVPLLRRALRDPGGRVFAALALARLEPPEPALLPALVEGLDAREGDLRWAAARVLVDLGRLHGEIVRVLLGLVGGDQPAGVRRMAIFCLRELAPDQPAVAAALVAASRDADALVRRAALVAMAGLLDPPAAVPERLADALEDADVRTAAAAALALGELAGRQRGALAERAARALGRRRAAAPAPALAHALDGALERLARANVPAAPARRRPDTGGAKR